MPYIDWTNLPKAVRTHLEDRLKVRVSQICCPKPGLFLLQKCAWDPAVACELERTEVLAPRSFGEFRFSIDPGEQCGDILRVYRSDPYPIQQMLFHSSRQSRPFDPWHSGAEQVPRNLTTESFNFGRVAGILEAVHAL